MLNVCKGALSGLIVCDFSWVGAGPIATSVLAQAGAQVIKIESTKRPDILRKGEPFKDGVSSGLDRSGYFSARNANKQDIALDMTHPKAREVAARLIAKSDIVINNFRVGQMEKWGLGWEDVQKLNPRAIYVTMSLQGLQGPHSRYMGFGVNLNALCGLTSRAGEPNQPPFGTGTNYTDHVIVPTHTLFGIMAALLERELTGKGQTVALSQLESAIAVTPSAAMAYAANSETLGPLGQGDERAAPHGVYRTLGYRRWIALSVFTDDQWAAFKELLGNPAWAEADAYASLQARKHNELSLNAAIENFTRAQQGEWFAEALCSRGIAAAMVRDAREVVDDPMLREDGFWVYLDHPEVGYTLYNRAPIKMSETPLVMRTAAPSIGQDTKEILAQLLGYTETEITQMSDDEVLV